MRSQRSCLRCKSSESLKRCKLGGIMTLRQAIKKVARKFGYDIVRYHPDPGWKLPPDLSQADKDIIVKVQPFTMTSVERIATLIDAVKGWTLTMMSLSA